MGGESIKPIRKRIHVYFLMTAYRFMSQGYILYEAEYLNLKTKKTTVFNKINLDAKGINCI